ncbi:MAG: hypothetical protein ACFE85_01405 [Candidatus Hodarchaeota archaeon]
MKSIIEKKKFIKTILILTFINIICLSTILVNINNIAIHSENDHILFNSKLISSSNGQALPYASISRNSSTVYRLFESIQFDINTSDFTNANYSIMQLQYENNEFKNFTMEHTTGANFSYTYTPEYDAPKGFCNVSFFIFNELNIQLNSHTTFVNFTIDSNYITYIENFEYNRNDTVYGELIVSNFKTYTFNWNVEIVDNTNESLEVILFSLGNNIDFFSFEINDSFTVYDEYYYVKIDMTDSSPANKRAATYIPFMVLNTLPEIIISSINFSKQEIKRAEDCTISLNVTDYDLETFPENITVNMLLVDSKGQSLPSIILTNNNDWSFSTTFSINIDKPIGMYQVTFEANDQYNGVGSYSTTLTVKNNYPEIHGFTINGLSLNRSISINYGEDIIFKFNVSDVEDTIAYITVGLLNEDNNWFNLSKQYQSNMELIIRTEDLLSGIWTVYLAVTDIDGDTTYITSNYGLGPKEIRIIPDLLSPVLPWITLFIGLSFGILLGIGLLYNRYKSKLTEFKVQSDKKEKPLEKPSKLKKPKKKIKEKIEVESKKEVEIIEEEQAEKHPQRKIKRKLG